MSFAGRTTSGTGSVIRITQDVAGTGDVTGPVLTAGGAGGAGEIGNIDNVLVKPLELVLKVLLISRSQSIRCW